VRREVLLLLVLLWFVSTPLFWRLQVSHAPSGNYGAYDVFDMAPYSIFHMSVFYALMFASFYVRRYSLFNILMLALYHPGITVLANYPYLTFRDVYLHAAPVRTLLAAGNLQGYLVRDPSAEFWPSTFVLHGVSALVLDSDLITINYVLYFCLVIGMALVIYCLAKRLDKGGYTLAWVCPILFLALFQNHINSFYSYDRSHLSAVLVLFLLFASVRFENRRGTIAQLLICGSLVTIHPMQSSYVSLFLLAPVALNILNRSRARVFARFNIALFSVVLFLAWFLFHTHVESEIIEMLGNFWTREYVQRVTNAVFVAEQLPLWGSILRNFYKYSLLSLLLIGPSAYVIRLFKRERLSDEPSTIVTLLSVSVASALFTPVLLALPAWGLYRASTDFLAIPAAFSSIIYLNHAIRKKRSTLNKNTMRLVLLAFVMTLSMTTFTLRFEMNQYYSELEHPSELSCLSFLFAHIQPSSRPHTIAASFQTTVWAQYYAYDSSHKFLRYVDPNDPDIYESQTRLFSSLTEAIDKSDFSIRGVRDMVLAPGQLQLSAELTKRLSEQTTLPKFNQIYSNWYFSLCSKRN